MKRKAHYTGLIDKQVLMEIFCESIVKKSFNWDIGMSVRNGEIQRRFEVEVYGPDILTPKKEFYSWEEFTWDYVYAPILIPYLIVVACGICLWCCDHWGLSHLYTELMVVFIILGAVIVIFLFLVALKLLIELVFMTIKFIVWGIRGLYKKLLMVLR